MSLSSQRNAHLTFSLRRSYFTEFVKRFKRSLFKRLTKNAMPIFFRANDIISTWPLVNGEYEPDVTELITHYARDRNYSDFFIDVGANIGLTAITVGSWFKEIHMYEPNPECVSILRVNAKNIEKTYTIHEFGLGLRDSMETLEVPGDNWGGAFINEENNAYCAENLKKLYSNPSSSSCTVQIKSAKAVFASLFSDLRKKNRKLGIVKIDVEGYESIIINSIAETIPDDFKMLIVFEDLMQTDFADLVAKFNGCARLFHIQKYKGLLSSTFKLEAVNPKVHSGSINMVLLVN